MAFLQAGLSGKNTVGEPDLADAMRDRGIRRLKQLREIAEAGSPRLTGRR